MWSFTIICLLINLKAEAHTSFSNDRQATVPSTKTWNVEDVIKKDHLHDDIKDIVMLEKSGELSEAEALFYFLTLHDFDGNGKLDGLEIMTATKHAAQHDNVENLITQDILAGAADGFLEFDANSDGFLTYTELRKTISEIQNHKEL